MSAMYKLMPAGEEAPADAVQWYVHRGWRDVTVTGIQPQGKWVMVVLEGRQPTDPLTLEEALTASHQAPRRRPTRRKRG